MIAAANVATRFRVTPAGFLVMGSLFLLPGAAGAAQFVGGPSVRVTANAQVEFRWNTDVACLGKLEVFTNADGTGIVLIKEAEDGGGNPLVLAQQTITYPVGSALLADTHYYFRVTASDPSKGNPDLITPTPFPSFFTGAQSLSNVQATSVTTTGATIAWGGNVFGFGKVAFGTSLLSQTVQDAFNITDHALELTGLSPGTTYQFEASNIHAIDGNPLASQTGQFTTASATASMVLTEPDAEPRVIALGQISAVSVRVKSQGNPISGATVGFIIDASSAGNGTLSAAQATSDVNGIATVRFTANRRGLVKINVFPSSAGVNSHAIPIVVR
jgi:hypothetical protein